METETISLFRFLSCTSAWYRCVTRPVWRVSFQGWSYPLLCPVPKSQVVLQGSVDQLPLSSLHSSSFLLTGSSSAACLSYRNDLNIRARLPSDFSYQPPRFHSANHPSLEEECLSCVLFFQFFEKYRCGFLDCWWSFLVNVDFHHHSAGESVVGVSWWKVFSRVEDILWATLQGITLLN